MRIQKQFSFALAASFALAGALAFLPTGIANSKPAKKITFTKDVAPIFYKSCAECHRAGEGATGARARSANEPAQRHGVRELQAISNLDAG